MIIQIKKTLKLIICSLVVGIFMGIASWMFLSLLHTVTSIRETHPELLLGLSLVGLLTVITYQFYGKGSHKGNNLILESIHDEAAVPFRMALFSFIFTILSHLFGGSVGREGTGVQIGGTFSYQISKIFKLDKGDTQLLLMAGISAGFGSVFGTPLAGVLFGMEVAFIGKLSLKAILPCLIASFSANTLCLFLGITHTPYPILSIPQWTWMLFGIILIASILYGWIGRLFSLSIHETKKILLKLIPHPLWRVSIGTSLVVVLMLSFDMTRFGGLSIWLIQAGFDGKVAFFDPLLKFFFTVLSLGSGLQGGEVTPLFGIGSSLGGLIGQLTSISPSLLAALGLLAVFGSATNTPIATIVLGIELFGINALPFYIISVLISYYTLGHHGIYSSQIIHRTKRPHLSFHKGKTLGSLRK